MTYYRFYCTGCGTRFNRGGCMMPASYPICPCCGTDYYVVEPGA